MSKLSRQVNPPGLISRTAVLLATALAGATALAQEAEVTPPQTESTESVATAETPEQAEAAEPGGEAAPETEPEATAEGQEAGEEATEAQAEERQSRFPLNHFGHRLQGGVGFLAGSGYQFEVAYGGEKFVDPETGEEQSIRHHRAPVFFDFQLSFGATEGLEVLLEYRLGLLEESWLNTARPMAFGVGVRYFISPLNRVKFFIGALLDIDFTRGLDTDVYLRPIFGLQVEIIRYVAFFLQASVNLSFIRAFGISLDGGGGFQFRFP